MSAPSGWAHEVLAQGPERIGLQALVLVWMGAMVAAAPRRVTPWAIAALALAVRLALATPGALMGRAYPYQHFLGYVGKIKSIPLYGQGWFATMDWMRPVFGADPSGLNRANLAFSVLTVVWLWDVVRRLTRDTRAATAAATLLACLPLAVSLSRLEVHFVLCALLEITAVVGVVRGDRLGAVLTVASAVVLAHARPFEIVFATAAALALAWRWRVAGALALAGIAVRVAEIGVPNGHDGFPNAAPDAWAPSTLARQIFGPDSSVALFNPHVHPAWLFPAAVVGGALAWRRGERAAVGVLAAGALLTTAPYAHMFFPTDVLRFQLPAATWWCALAGLSAPWIASRGVVVRVVLIGVWAAGVWSASAPLQGLLTVSEFRFLSAALPTLPAGATLRYDPVWDQNGLFAAWAERAGPVHAVPLDGVPPQVGELVYVGVGARVIDRPPGRLAPVGPACAGEVLREETVGSFSGGLYELTTPEAPVRLAIERVTACAP
jgi:hypothetical protein